MGRNLTFVCGDPGGAAAIAPVIELLRSEYDGKLACFAYHAGLKLLRDRGIDCEELSESVSTQNARQKMESCATEVLVTATSSNSLNWEHAFIDAARQMEITSLALLDFWSNYSQRFSELPGDLRYLPDTIAVMDSLACEEMAKEGFPRQRLVVTGQPAFDSLESALETFDSKRREAVLSECGAPADSWLVFFASQPLREFYGPPQSAGYLGFDEHTVLQSLVASLATLQHETGRAIVLVVRPHPREGKIQISSPDLRVHVTAEGRNADWLLAADLVVGMNSVVLMEACLLGCPVVSLQPGLSKPDCLPSNRWGASTPVYKQDRILETLRQLLTNTGARETLQQSAQKLRQRMPPHAARKVVELLERI